MCRSMNEGGRRCACTNYTRKLANQNRSAARQKRRVIATRAAEFGGDDLGRAVSVLPPSRLAAFLIAADQTRPGTMHEFASDLGNLPGIHNMVTEDRRDRTSETGKKNNSGKLDQHAIAEVQGAVLEFDKARLDDGEGLSGAEREKLERSIDVREKAIKLGLLDGKTVTNARVEDMTPEQLDFYASIAPEDIPALVDVQGRVSRQFWERHLEEANFVTEKRNVTDGLRLHDEHGIPKTLEGLLNEHGGKAIKLSDDLILTRNADGQIVLDDRHNRTQVTAQGFMRAEDALARLPRVTDVKLPNKASSTAQRLVDEKFLDPTSKVGANHLNTLRAGAAQAMFSSGVPVNRGEDGKAPWQDHRFLANAGLARPVVSNNTPRIEGYELSGHMRAAALVKDRTFAETAKAMGVKMTTDESTKHGSKRTAPDARYRGALKTPQRDAASRGGFRVRSDKGGANSPERKALDAISASAFDAKPPADMVTLADRRLGAGLAAQVGEANRLLRFGANPETVGERAHVAVAKLDESFRTRKAVSHHTPTVINTVATVPSSWDAADGDYLSKVFATGSRVDTVGYTSGAVNGSDADVSAAGPRQYKVQYLSTGHLSQPGGGAVIGDKTGFRVHSIDRSGPVPVVRMVQDDLAADLAAGNATL